MNEIDHDWQNANDVLQGSDVVQALACQIGNYQLPGSEAVQLYSCPMGTGVLQGSDAVHLIGHFDTRLKTVSVGGTKGPFGYQESFANQDIET